MRKPQAFILSGICLALVVTVAAQLIRSREPRYQGRSLSQWLHQLPSKYPDSSPPVSPEGEAAIRHMGPNAIATALEWISYEPSTPRRWLSPLLRRVGESRRPRLLSQAYRRAKDAEMVFVVLGPDAKAAIPELWRLAATSRGEARVGRCVRALESIGPEALPAFLTLMENPQVKDRGYIIEQVRGVGTNAFLAIPVLLKQLNDPDREISGMAALTLSFLPATNRTVIEIFTARLQSSNLWSRLQAACVLGRLGVAARTAVPALRQALADPDPSMREQASYALDDIESEPATNVPEKSLELPAPTTSP